MSKSRPVSPMQAEVVESRGLLVQTIPRIMLWIPSQGTLIYTKSNTGFCMSPITSHPVTPASPSPLRVRTKDKPTLDPPLHTEVVQALLPTSLVTSGMVTLCTSLQHPHLFTTTRGDKLTEQMTLDFAPDQAQPFPWDETKCAECTKNILYFPGTCV